MRIAAIDQGTTSTRVLVADSSGRASIRHAVRHEQFYPAAGRVEHSPLELLANIRTCLREAGPVDAIGLANQGESCLAWDAVSGEPLSPVIVWQDSRSADHIEKMRGAGAQAHTLELAGLPLDAYFSASKLGWLLRESEPVARAYREGRLRLGTTDSFFLDRLSGTFVTDVATASRTSLMNLRTGAWDSTLCRLFGVPVECLAEIRPNVSEFGRIDGIPVTASIVDQQAALYGHGCRLPGDTKITFGTGAFALSVTGSAIVLAPERGLLPTVAWKIGDETTYALDGGVYNASSAIEWCGSLGLFADLSDINAFAAPAAVSRGLVFVPALSGLACPHWDRSASALWIGMDPGTTRGDLCQAALEGVALRAVEVIEAMSEYVSVNAQLTVDGGMARNPYFTQFLADASGRTLLTRQFDELTAYGCAALACLATGDVLPPADDRSATIRPGVPAAVAQEWRSTFTSAVCRSRGWRVDR